MPNADFYDSGSWNAYCSMCNGTYKASELKKHWQGMWRCHKCWEPRNAQDFVKAGPPDEPPPFIQPPNDVFVEDICTLNNRSGIPDYATPGCAIPGNTLTI